MALHQHNYNHKSFKNKLFEWMTTLPKMKQLHVNFDCLSHRSWEYMRKPVTLVLMGKLEDEKYWKTNFLQDLTLSHM